MSLPSLPLGTLLDGRYRLTALLGEGGMGTVYEGTDVRLTRRVAIKVIVDEDDDTLAERLFREAKAAARAEHPAVLTTYGYGSDPELGVSYVVTERLQGETVAQRIEQVGALPLALTLRIGIEVADALTAVHAAGVIHRDLKPSNLFLASRGMRVDELKLLDFGVAKQLDLQTLTATGQVYGTPMYMAPEQLVDSKRVDARSDLYALGAVLLECLTGRPPFAAASLAALALEVALGPTPDPHLLAPSAPRGLTEVVARCMMKRPSERYPDARSVYMALREV